VWGLVDALVVKAENLEFSPEVRVYAGRIFHDYGMCKAPELMPSAIMPPGVESDDAPKNAALRELFDEKIRRIHAYMT
jgi:hypothetical protein